MMFPIHRLYEPGELVTVTSATCHGFDMSGQCWRMPIGNFSGVVLSAESLDIDGSRLVVLHDMLPVLWEDGDVVCVWDYHVSRVSRETT